MNCPACSNVLQQIKIGDVTIDACKNGCGGIWFDNFEMKKFDKAHESTGKELLNIARNPNVIVDHSKRLKCPRCDDVVMMRHFFSVKKQVELDECPGCGGIWLDYGELGQIKNLFKTENERHKAAEKYFNDIFGDNLKAIKNQTKTELNQANKIANVLRFICPSNYIPGKQNWGAF